MTQASSSFETIISDDNAVNHQAPTGSRIEHIVEDISKTVLPGKEHFESFMRHKWRMNHKPHSLRGSFQAASLFLSFYCNSGKSQLREIVSDDLEAFVEQ